MTSTKLIVVALATILMTTVPGSTQEPAVTDAEKRLAAALKRAHANEPSAIPELIDLLPSLPVRQREKAEEFLLELAGEWAPIRGPMGIDETSLRIRKAAWAAWWANVDGPALLAALRKHTLAPDEQQKVKQAIARLGDASLPVREKAVLELVSGGRRNLPLLRNALKDSTLEMALRIQRCVRRIETESAERLPSAAPRLLALRRPDGAADALLAYLPFADEETLPALNSALAVLALNKDGKAEPAMLKALAHPRPAIRAAAAVALAKRGAALPAVRKLLADADTAVRLDVGQALAPQDAQAVSVLIGMMAELSADQAWQLHEFLTPLAGDKAPPYPDDSPAGRKKAAAAWAAWWKDNAADADLGRLNAPTPQLLGYIVICESTGKVYELGRDRKPRWSFNGANSPVDVRVLPNNRVLLAESGKVTERDLKGNIIWEKRTNGSPYNVQRLPNGNTLIGTSSEALEVDKSGKDVLRVSPGGALTGAYKDRLGRIYCRTPNGTVSRYDAAGKLLGSFNTFADYGWLDLRPNGNLLWSQNSGNKVCEYDRNGKQILDLSIPNAKTVTGLPNGNLLVACPASNQVVEVNRKGQVIWQYKAQQPFRARIR